MKKLSIVALILAIMMLFTGCAKDGLELYKAFNKSQEITSLENEAVLKLNLKGEGLSPEHSEIVQQVANILNSSEMVIKQKTMQNEEGDVARAYVEMEFDIGDIKVPFSIWVDADLSGEELNLVEIIKLPKAIMTLTELDNESKEYIVYDFVELMESTEAGLDFSGFMEFIKDIQPKAMDLSKNYMEDFKPEIESISHKGKRNVDGEFLDIYELKLDDELFKEFIRYTVNYSLENKELIQFINDYMEAMMSMMPTPDFEESISDEELAEIKEELSEEELIEFEKNMAELEEMLSEGNLDQSLGIDAMIPMVKEKFNEFMDNTADIRIIGDEDIVLEYGINKDGYIAYEAGKIDLLIDIEAISKALSPLTGEEPIEGVLNLEIEYSTRTFNINEEIKVELPEIDEDNSISFVEFMENQLDVIVEIENTEEVAE